MRVCAYLGALALIISACSDKEPRGTIGTPGPAPNPMGGNDGSVGVPDPTANDCNIMRARWVYLIDNEDRLLRFEPDTLSFIPLGTLTCDPESSPFSMSVDRNATAWVLYQNGQLYQASTVDAACQPTNFQPGQHGFELFGMGFAADDEENTSETLYVAGGPVAAANEDGVVQLATLDLASMMLNPLGDSFVGLPEMTGTGTGQLWGFVPGGAPQARRFVKEEARVDHTIPIDAIPAGEQAHAWAFAFWGGRFYVFLMHGDNPSTNVYIVDPTDQSSRLAMEDTTYRIVGAGVSTCAPTTLI